MPNLFIPLVCFNPPERLMLEHFLPALFSIGERAILGFWLDAIVACMRIECRKDCFLPLYIVPTFWPFLYLFTVNISLYDRQKVFRFTTIHFVTY